MWIRGGVCINTHTCLLASLIVHERTSKMPFLVFFACCMQRYGSVYVGEGVCLLLGISVKKACKSAWNPGLSHGYVKMLGLRQKQFGQRQPYYWTQNRPFGSQIVVGAVIFTY